MFFFFVAFPLNYKFNRWARNGKKTTRTNIEKKKTEIENIAHTHTYQTNDTYDAI